MSEVNNNVETLETENPAVETENPTAEPVPEFQQEAYTVSVENPDGTTEELDFFKTKAELKDVPNLRGVYLDQTPYKPEEFKDILAKFVDVSPGIAEYTASLRSWIRQARFANDQNTGHWYAEFEYNEGKYQAFSEFLSERMGYVINCSSPIFLSASRNVNMPIPEVILNCDIDDGVLKVFAVGDVQSCIALDPIMRAFFPKRQIRFAEYRLVNGSVQESSVNMSSEGNKQPMSCFYPWLKETGMNLQEFYQEFLRSDESILILMGPPGTGKTTFIRGLLNNTNASVGMCSDTILMANDPGFLVNKLSSGTHEIMVFEDADVLITKTPAGQRNAAMASILNTADGLTSNENNKVKMIFTTNLTDESHLEEALIRDGRCFALVYFGELNEDEAEVVAKELGVVGYDAEKSSRHTLASISMHCNTRIKFRKVRRLGANRATN